MQAAGNEVTALCGARSQLSIILHAEIESSTSEAAWATEDGSLGFHGNVVELMQAWFRTQSPPPALVHLVGPVRIIRLPLRSRAAGRSPPSRV